MINKICFASLIAFVFPSLTYCLDVSPAQSNVSTITNNSISVGDADYFESISIQGKTISFQYIRSVNTEFSIFWNSGKIANIEVKVPSDDKVRNIHFAVDGDGRLFVVKNKISPASKYFLESINNPFKKNLCSSKIDPFMSLSNNLHPIIKTQSSNSLRCNDRAFIAKIPEAIEKVNSTVNKQGLHSCILEKDNPLVKSGLPNERINEIIQKISAKRSQFQSNNSLLANKIVCNDAEVNNASEGPASSSDDGSISININHPRLKTIKNISAEYEKLIAHETLHLAGLEQSKEALVNDIINFCQSRKFLSNSELTLTALATAPKTPGPKIQTIIQPIADKPSAPPIAEAGGVGRAQSLAGATPVSVRSAPEINQLVRTQPNPREMAQMVRSGGLANAVEYSKERTAPLREYVNAAMETFVPRAEASPTIAAASSASKRTPASSGSMMGKKIKGRDGNEYTVVEEYTSDTKQNAKSTSLSTTERKPSSTASATASGSSSASAVNASENSGEVARASSASTARPTSASGPSTTSSIGSGSKASASGSRPSPARGIASVENNDATTKTLSIFSEKKYSDIKQNLNKASFQSQLREADITIVDSSGNRYGADKGRIIYMDKGNRFVRMR